MVLFEVLNQVIHGFDARVVVSLRCECFSEKLPSCVYFSAKFITEYLLLLYVFLMDY